VTVCGSRTTWEAAETSMSPTVDIALNQQEQIQLRIGANQESRLLIEELGAFAQTVSQRSNHDQLQGVPTVCQWMESSVRTCSGVGAGAP
jgi:hypothetical protein